MGMRYAVIGTGGIGAYYGCRLAAAGKDVHFVLRSDFGEVSKNGFRIDSVAGDIVLPEVNAYASAEDLPPVDVVLVCTKTLANAAFEKMLASPVAAGAAVVLIQNGLGMEERLQASFPDAKIIGATAFICSSRIAPGHIAHTAYGELTLASARAGEEALLDAIRQDMEESGVPCHICPSLPLMRWKKLVWNIPYNGLCVVNDCKTDALTFDSGKRELVIAMMKEVIGAAAACGVEIDGSFVDAMISSTEQMAPYYPSMYLDYRAGRPLEIGSIYSAPIEAAAKAGFDMVLARDLRKKLIALTGAQDK